MINFQQGHVWKLKQVPNERGQEMLEGLLIDGEYIVSSFVTARDMVIFTNKRIVSVDVQGITGSRKSFATMPYSNIQYFTIQTVGFIEAFPDSELFISFNNGFTATFEFKTNVNMREIGKMISQYVL